MTARQWLGVYYAVVARNDDPAGAQRVTLRVPMVLGTATSQWAVPGSATGGSPPAVNSAVSVMFLGGDINHPVYLVPVTTSFGGGNIDGGTAVTTGTPASILNGGSA